MLCVSSADVSESWLCGLWKPRPESPPRPRRDRAQRGRRVAFGSRSSVARVTACAVCCPSRVGPRARLTRAAAL